MIEYVVGKFLSSRLWKLFFDGHLKCMRCDKCFRPLEIPRKLKLHQRPICQHCSEALLMGWDPGEIHGWAGWEIDPKTKKITRPMIRKAIGASKTPQKGSWYAVLENEDPFDETSPVVRIVYVYCPSCGRPFALDKHGIDAGGTVNPSVICPFERCRYHEFVTLGGWDGSVQKEKEKKWSSYEWHGWKGEI